MPFDVYVWEFCAPCNDLPDAKLIHLYLQFSFANVVWTSDTYENIFIIKHRVMEDYNESWYLLSI